MRKRGPREITAIDECPNCGTKVSRKYVFLPNPDMYWFLTQAHRATEEREALECHYEEFIKALEQITTVSGYSLWQQYWSGLKAKETEAYARLGRYIAETLQKP